MKLDRKIYNFSPGPAMLPESVLRRAQSELLNWKGLGVSVMEISDLTRFFQEFLKDLRAKIRKILSVPENYQILFLTGGATGQFSSIPLNLLGKNPRADYLVTGWFSKIAMQEATKYGKIHCVTNERPGQITPKEEWKLSTDAAYLFYCPNESAQGLAFPDIPESGSIPIVADMTSYIFSSSIDVSRFGLIFASAQKQIGQTGVSLVIVRDDLLDQACPITPLVWNYNTQAKENSCVNTMPTYATYIMDLMMDWILEQGGVEVLEKKNRRKSKKLYDFIDQSNFYVNPVQDTYRSFINVPFFSPTKELNEKFIEEADREGLKFLKGFLDLGGMRASLYNAMPESGVDALIAFMEDFMHRNRSSSKI